MSKERGLPQQKRMRHDSHFVEELTGEAAPAGGTLLVDVARIEAASGEPSGKLDELLAEVQRTGTIEPIVVRESGAGYRIVAGERRFRAAVAAGLKRVPCIEVDVDAREMLEASLIDDLKRGDLGPFEEAAGLQRLSDEFRYTHLEIAQKLGRTRTVVTETLSLDRMPEEIRERCRQVGVTSKSMLLQVVRQADPEAMGALVERIAAEGLGRDEARRLNPAGRRQKTRGFTYCYRPEDENVEVRLSFAQKEVAPGEILRAAECAVAALRRDLDKLT